MRIKKDTTVPQMISNNVRAGDMSKSNKATLTKGKDEDFAQWVRPRGPFTLVHDADTHGVDVHNAEPPGDEIPEVISRVIDAQVVRPLTPQTSQNDARPIMTMRGSSIFAERWQRTVVKDNCL